MNEAEEIKKRAKHREDMCLRRLFGMLGKMAKADGKVDAWETHAAEAELRQATAKMAQLNAAWEKIRRARGI